MNYINSATAKTSCQSQTKLKEQSTEDLGQQVQSQLVEEQQQQDKSKTETQRQPVKRYQGHHPHFHHHTAPAYYTDLHLRIHTPEPKDAINENYQSVYRTPSKLVKDERQFPKTTTATVAPPPISRISPPTAQPSKLNEPSAAGKEPPVAVGTKTPQSDSFFRGGSSEIKLRKGSDPYIKQSATAKGNFEKFK